MSDLDWLYSHTPIQQTFPTPSDLLRAPSSIHPTNNNNNNKSQKPESARKARQRAMAESIGYTPTDPDSISSHEKKRHYLECLEHYVTHLHEQLRAVGVAPVPLECVLASGRGLSSRAIRTLLVHMEYTARQLNAQLLQEEQTFMDLRDRAYVQVGLEVESDMTVYPPTASDNDVNVEDLSPVSNITVPDNPMAAYTHQAYTIYPQ